MLEALGLPGPRELLLFMGAVLVLNATPGVDFLLTVSRTLQAGARAGAAAALGISAGCVVHALAAAFGLAALLALRPGAFWLIQWAGAAYLAWLGLGLLWQAWRQFQRKVHRLGPGLLGVEGPHLAQHLVQVEAHVLDAHLAGLDAREIQHVIEHGQQRMGRAVDQLQPVALLRVQR